MDPDACLDLLLEALTKGDGDKAEDHAEDLNAWLAKGGFESRRSAEVEVSRALVDADLADGECPQVEELLSRLRAE